MCVCVCEQNLKPPRRLLLCFDTRIKVIYNEWTNVSLRSSIISYHDVSWHGGCAIANVNWISAITACTSNIQHGCTLLLINWKDRTSEIDEYVHDMFLQNISSFTTTKIQPPWLNAEIVTVWLPPRDTCYIMIG